MSQQTPLVSFITVNYNQTELTLELIESIYKYTKVSFEIIVVDNASKVSPESKISRIYPDVRIIVSGVNRGYYPTSAQEVEVDVIQYAGATNVNPFTGRNVIIGDKQLNQSQYYQSKPTFYAGKTRSARKSRTNVRVLLFVL